MISFTTPAATVVPMSRMAKRPNSGKSRYVSTEIGCSGSMRTQAASPVLRKLGCSSVTWPVRGSIFFSSSMNLHCDLSGVVVQNWCVTCGDGGWVVDDDDLADEFFGNCWWARC